MAFLNETGLAHLVDKIKSLVAGKVSKTGDTITGPITTNTGTTGWWVYARDAAAIKTPKAAITGHVASSVSMNTVNGNWTMSTFANDDALRFVYSSNSNYNSNTNKASSFNIPTTGIIDVSHGGTGAASLTGQYGLLGKLFDNRITSAEYIPAFTTNWADGGFMDKQELRNALGLGDTLDALPIANGGTGATTADAALNNLAYKGVIGAVDWNTLSTGYYKISLSDGLSADYNQPNGAYGYGTLLVTNSTSEKNISQIYIPYTYNASTKLGIYIREQHSSTTTFSAWRYLPTLDEVNSLGGSAAWTDVTSKPFSTVDTANGLTVTSDKLGFSATTTAGKLNTPFLRIARVYNFDATAKEASIDIVYSVPSSSPINTISINPDSRSGVSGSLTPSWTKDGKTHVFTTTFSMDSTATYVEAWLSDNNGDYCLDRYYLQPVAATTADIDAAFAAA